MTYPDQIDCAWLAVDVRGALAAMITAGCGPIPEQVLSHPVDVADIERLLLDLPKIGGVRLNTQVPDPASYIALSDRGLFVYDWTDVHGTSDRTNAYELVAAPTVALSLERLPADLRSLAARLGGEERIGEKALTVSGTGPTNASRISA